MKICSPQFEIHTWAPTIALVGRDPGTTEMRKGQPFVGRAGTLLNACLMEAGILRDEINIMNVVGTQPPGDRFERHRDADIVAGIKALYEMIDKTDPELIVTLGNEAAFALIEDWPTTRNQGGIKNASGIEQRRGYFWESVGGRKVLTTVHPAAVLRQWTPWRTLLTYDLARAKEDVAEHGRELVRPVRQVEIVV